MADSYALTVKSMVGDGPLPRRAARAGREDDDAILKEALDRWNRCDEAESAQRKAILTAKQFRAGDQWPSAIRIQREGGAAIQGQAAQPPRPCLTVDRLSPAVRQVSNQIKAANFAIDVLPNGFGADEDTADLFKGYLRRMQVQARAESPVEWAADGAIEGGLGWFRLRTDYVYESWEGDPSDPAVYDQELKLERIANPLTVYCDPSALKPTRSDAQFMFVTEDLSKDEFERRWPSADVTSLEAFTGTGNMKAWVSDDSIRIAEYWRIRYQDRTVSLLADGSTVTGELPKGTTAVQRRVIRAPIVEGFKINAVQVLERWQWVGSRIPLIPVLGEELNVDGRPILRGVIQEGMDAQRMVNYTYSGAMEIFALGNKSPYVVEEEQLGDYQAIWQTANVYNYSYLPYKAVPNAPPPHRDMSEAPIQAAVALMVKSEDAIKATTSIYDPGLGNFNPQERSGRAVQALQAQSELSSSNYSASVGRALTYAGQLAVEIIPKITRPGQLLQLIGHDDVPEQVIVGQPYADGPNGPRPIDPKVEQFQKGLHQFYDLKAGKYAITVDVGKGSTTQRQEGMMALGQLIPHLPPEMAAVATPEYVRQMSFPGAQKIAEMLEKALPPALQPSEDEDTVPPQLKAQLQQLQAQNQQLQQALATKQPEIQAKLQQTQMQEQAETARAQDANAVALQKAEIAATASMSNAQAKVDAENFRSYVDAMETRLAKSLDLHFKATAEHLQQTHALIQQVTQHAHEAGMAGLTHEHALAQGQQAAALTPEPTNPQAGA